MAQDEGMGPVVLPLAAKARGLVPGVGVGVPDVCLAPRFAETSTPASPRRPGAGATAGVGVADLLLPTRYAQTPTPPRGTRWPLRNGATAEGRETGLPGVGRSLLPTRLVTTSDTQGRAVGMDAVDARDVTGRVGNRAGRDGLRSLRMLRARTRHQHSLNIPATSVTSCRLNTLTVAAQRRPM